MSKYSKTFSTSATNGVSPLHRLTYLLNEKTPFSVMEAFRNIKASLSVSIPKTGKEGTVVMMASALPNDGKTTVAVNLALMFALSDSKVVLVDADIRKGRISKFFKQKREPGLSNFLAGQVSMEELVRPSNVNKNLSFIPCGTSSPRPYELLESEEMNGLIENLRKEYDYIIIDTSPMLVVSDALALTNLVDGAVLVCRHMQSNTDDIEQAVKTLKFSKVNLLGLIINDFKGEMNKLYGKGTAYEYRSYSSYANKQAYNLGSTVKDSTAQEADKKNENV